MAIHVIHGRAGSGKSAKIYELARGHIHAGGKAILLVPEQFTLQAEREILSALGDEGMMDMQVLSVTKLMEDVFSRVRSPKGTLIDAKGRALAIKHIASHLDEELNLFDAVSKRSGFATALQELFGDLKRFDVGTAELGQVSDKLKEGSLIQRKLSDVSRLMEHYEAFMEAGHFTGHEDRVNALIEILPEAVHLKDHIIYADGYDYLPPQNLRLLGVLAQCCIDVYVSVSVDFAGSDQGLFLTGSNNYYALQQTAECYGQRSYTIPVDRPHYQKHPSILHLEQNIQAYPAKEYHGEGSITIKSAKDGDEEVASAADTILRMVQDQGIRFRDIAVLCGNFPQYEHTIRRIFDRYGIPAFIDARRPVSQHPVVTWLLSALKVGRKQPYRDDVIRLVKSGFAGLDPRECAYLEDYCLDNAIQGNLFKLSFRRGAKRYDLEQLNKLRLTALTPSYLLPEEDQAVKDWVQAIMDMMERANIKDQLDREEMRLIEEGYLEIAAETAQAYNVVIETLEQLHELLREDVLPLDEVIALLEEAFFAAQVGILPTAPDQVLVGDVGRSKLPAVKVVYVLGANEGALPIRHGEGGIFGDRELDILKSHGLVAGRDAVIKRAESNYSTYEILTKPTEQLILSYDASEGRLPSMIIDRITGIFPEMEVAPCEVDPLLAPAAALYMSSKALGALGDGRQPRDGRWRGALSALMQDQNYREQIHKMRGFASGLSSVVLDSAIRDGNDIISSVSQLEEYARCPFAYMVSYGLNPHDDPGEGVNPAGEGAFLHEVMEKFGKRLSKIDDPTALSDEELGAIMSEEAVNLAQGFDDGTFLQNKRTEFHAKQLVRTAQRGASVYARELRSSDFDPIAYEAAFGADKDFPPIEIALKNGAKAILRGKIDRVDRATIEGQDYYRTIDYKSGLKDVNLPGIKSGSDLQLFVYMDALLSGKENARSAGVFHFPLRDDFTDDGQDVHGSERLKGLLVGNEKVVNAMDHTLQPGEKSEVAPIKLKKDGTPAKSASIKDQGYVDAAIRAAKDTAHRLLDDMSEGKMSIKPQKDGQKTACDYCQYRSICGFGAVSYDYQTAPSKEEADQYIEAHREEDDA